jgi:hypothetical protein
MVVNTRTSTNLAKEVVNERSLVYMINSTPAAKEYFDCMPVVPASESEKTRATG